MTNQCVHGQLARQCPLCEKDAEISGLRTALLEASLAAQRVSEAAMLALGHAHERSKREPSSGGLMECAVEPTAECPTDGQLLDQLEEAFNNCENGYVEQSIDLRKSLADLLVRYNRGADERARRGENR